MKKTYRYRSLNKPINEANLLMRKNTMSRLLISIFSLCVCLSANVNAADLNVTDLNNNVVQKWEQKLFDGQTTYSILQHKGQRALKAVSDGTASGLLLKKKIDLQNTPFLNWSWLIEQKLPGLNERSKAGDDFAARVYIVIDGGLMAWRAKICVVCLVQ